MTPDHPTPTPTLTWELLVSHAAAMRASDVHMHVKPDGSATVRARLDGVLTPWGELPKAVVTPALNRMRTAANLTTGAAFLVGEGRVRYDTQRGPLDMRITITPLVGGATKIAVRLPSLDTSRSLDELGFSTENYARMEQLLSTPDGLVLTTGPVGSGKTTTLLAALDRVGGPGRSVVTVEDPVERVVPGADQIEVHEQAGFTYEHILKSLLRMDMDALLIGEIRDQATARHAIQIAKAGRLVLSTLHSGSAVGALLRLHELSGLGTLEVAESVRGVVSQRLVRKVHQDCAGAGCQACMNTGFQGRVPVHEVLLVTDAMRDALVNREPSVKLIALAQDAGMTTFAQDAERWLADGTSTASELERVVGRG